MTEPLPIPGRTADGSRGRPYSLILHENVEPYLLESGKHEGDLVQPNGTLGGWWRIVYDRYIPIAS